MPATKRKALDGGLQRRVRVRRASNEDVESVASLPSLGSDPSSDDEGNSDSGESEVEVRTIHLSFE
jgi:hypothetical protein